MTTTVSRLGDEILVNTATASARPPEIWLVNGARLTANGEAGPKI